MFSLRKNTAGIKPNWTFPDIFPWLLLCLTYFIAILFQAKYGDDLLNSDMAAEMLLANEMNKSGELFLAKNWAYSTEIRVLYQHIPLRFGLLLFPNNWHYARILGQAIMLALHAGSFIYMMSVLGYKKAGVYGAAALMCPFGYWYTFHGFYGGAYLTHMILFSVTIGMIFSIVQSPYQKKAILLTFILTILCFVQGINGVRMLMNLFAPFCLTVLIVFVLQLNEKPIDKPFFKDPLVKLVLLSLYTAIVCLCGYLFNSLVLSKTYTYSSFNGQIWQSFSISNLLSSWSTYLTLFGYPYIEFAQWISATPWTNILLFSKQGILAAASIVLMATVLFSMFRLFKLWNRLSISHKIIALLLPVSLLVCGISFSCLLDSVNDFTPNGTYYLPLIPLTFAHVIIWLLNEDFRLPKLFQTVIASVLLLCIVCTSVTSAHRFVIHPSRTALNMKAVGQWLIENDYRQGYATPWYSDVLTEHTSGQIEMWTLENPTSHTVYPWLQACDHLEQPPEGKCFILLTQWEYEDNKDALPYRIEEDTIVYNEYGYIVLGYDSIENALK